MALVGRPNVGKSTLFNRLTNTRDALVHDQPGVTRDRRYGRAVFEEQPYIVIDTGGLEGSRDDPFADQIASQANQAIAEADVVVLLVDAQDGLVRSDQEILDQMRRAEVEPILAVNKIDGRDADIASAEFYATGLPVMPIAAAHNRGISDLMEAVWERMPPAPDIEPPDEGVIRVAVVGRPNAGKSTLINRFLGEERLLASEVAGTTRDALDVSVTWEDRDFVFVDTAGIRKRARVHDTVEKFSVIKALQSIESSQVVIMMLDARRGASDQDATIVGHILDAGRPLVLAINKWDGLERHERTEVLNEIHFRLGFVDFAEAIPISALHGSQIKELLEAAERAYQSANADLSTPQLSDLINAATQAHAPPGVGGRSIKIRYAHQGGRNPPVIVLHGNRVDKLPETYRRYLTNYFRKHLKLVGTPLRLVTKTGKNPFDRK